MGRVQRASTERRSGKGKENAAQTQYSAPSAKVDLGRWAGRPVKPPSYHGLRGTDLRPGESEPARTGAKTRCGIRKDGRNSRLATGGIFKAI